MDRGAWQAIVQRVIKIRTQLSDFHFHQAIGLQFSFSCVFLSAIHTSVMLAFYNEFISDSRASGFFQRSLIRISINSYSQSYGFSSSHVWMWELDYKEGWVLKNWCFWTVVLEKTLESALDCKKIKPVNLKEINHEYSLEVLMLKVKLWATWFKELTH